MQHPAHFREDLVLLQLLDNKVSGSYIDIGANDPYRNSNTHPFYENGWRGIDVEPVHEMAEKLKVAHPENIVIEAVIGAEEKFVDFYVPDFAELHWQQIATTKMNWVDYHKSQRPDERWLTVTMQQFTLNYLFDLHDKDVDFVSIDVEGSEIDVIEGWDITKYRPLVVCIEAVTVVDDSSWKLWEPKLLPYYNFVCHDIQNRFYLRK